MELFRKDKATCEASETAKERKNRIKQDEQPVETIDDIDQLLETNEISLENFTTGDNDHLTPQVHLKTSRGPKEWRLELDWPTRYRICIDIARGLAFLHEESRLKIVHRDIKATNILLDKNINAKISDFGLAKLDEEDDTHINTRVAGTYGYMAPEYALRGYLTDKADVYSYGVVLLEIVSGMANVSDRGKENHFVLLDRAVELNDTGNIMELVDSRLNSEYDLQEMMVVINLALLCTTTSPTDRPTMSSVVGMLEGRIVPQSFVVNKSMSMTKRDREKMMKQLESTNDSQIEEMSIPYTDSSMSAVDLYPADRFSEYLQKRDGDSHKLLS
ncbi:probable leucine-rich repeat receptor-like serine/threonine-protein kinase [Tanacetum coccineum]